MKRFRKKSEKTKVAQAHLSITDAGAPLSVDQSGRARRYFISMMIRTACFIAAVILPSPWRWISLAGALLLPYVAVVVANAGRETVNKKSVSLDNDFRSLEN